MNEDMLNIEKEFHDEDPESMLTDDVNVQDRDLPKRVLAYSTQKLLEELSKNHKTSVDGTFKSSCYLWTQQFIWMIKSKGYLVPVV